VVNNGFLEITAKLETRTCGDWNHTPAQWKYTSAMVQWRTFSFTYGTVEFRVKAPGGTGPWPAIWLLGKNCQDTNVMGADNQGACHWPDPGSDEIDILEILHGNRNACNQQIHSGSNNGGCVAQLPDQSLGFHTHQMIWAPGSLTWKIDGVQTCRITSGVPSTPMYLMINIAMGGFGGAVNDATLPQTMVVDYLKVTQ